jgi:hypothetical protein
MTDSIEPRAVSVRVPLAARAVEPSAIALRVPQAARAIGVQERLLWKLIAAHKIPTSRIGRCTVIRVEDLDHFVRESQIETSEVVAPVSVRTRRTNPATRQRRSA